MGTEGVPVVIAALHDPFLAEDTSRKSELRFLVAATDVQGSTPDGRALEDQILPVVALSEGVDLLIGKVRIEAIIDRLFVVEQGVFPGIQSGRSHVCTPVTNAHIV